LAWLREGFTPLSPLPGCALKYLREVGVNCDSVKIVKMPITTRPYSLVTFKWLADIGL